MEIFWKERESAATEKATETCEDHWQSADRDHASRLASVHVDDRVPRRRRHAGISSSTRLQFYPNKKSANSTRNWIFCDQEESVRTSASNLLEPRRFLLCGFANMSVLEILKRNRAASLGAADAPAPEKLRSGMRRQTALSNLRGDKRASDPNVGMSVSFLGRSERGLRSIAQALRNGEEDDHVGSLGGSAASARKTHRRRSLTSLGEGRRTMRRMSSGTLAQASTFAILTGTYADVDDVELSVRTEVDQDYRC